MKVLNLEEMRLELEQLKTTYKEKKEALNKAVITANKESIRENRELLNALKEDKKIIEEYETLISEMETNKELLSEDGAEGDEGGTKSDVKDEVDIKGNTKEVKEEKEEGIAETKEVVEQSQDVKTKQEERSDKKMNFNEDVKEVVSGAVAVEQTRNSEDKYAQHKDYINVAFFKNNSVEGLRTEAMRNAVKSDTFKVNGQMVELFNDEFVNDWRTIEDLRKYVKVELKDKIVGHYYHDKGDDWILKARVEGEDAEYAVLTGFELREFVLKPYSLAAGITGELSDMYGQEIYEMIFRRLADAIVRCYNKLILDAWKTNLKSETVSNLETFKAVLTSIPLNKGIGGTPKVITDNTGYLAISDLFVDKFGRSYLGYDWVNNTMSKVLGFDIEVVNNVALEEEGIFYVGYSNAATKVFNLKNDRYLPEKKAYFENKLNNTDNWVVHQHACVIMPPKAENDNFIKVKYVPAVEEPSTKGK